MGFGEVFCGGTSPPTPHGRGAGDEGGLGGGFLFLDWLFVGFGGVFCIIVEFSVFCSGRTKHLSPSPDGRGGEGVRSRG